ncbi:TonB-dependent receptor [Sphingomonas sp. MG17]|uniref:TonB-dependent receptor n=1 Tax=Sphingomonas tagetis TaxID=2949092 RepID=A0A9X2HJ51_9SPHN|nr:TonB-dependent receptor [Sphingomonas tagetis]MCP3730582.1 TonB-dependent receptor [Sphingomonas tagetis]
MKKSGLYLSAGILSAAISAPAFAQTAPASESDPALGEIIVTATKRPERLQDVAIAVTVVSSEQLAKSTIASPGDLKVPGVQFVATTGRATALSVRGVSTGGNPGFDQSVPIFIDGVYFGRGGMARAGFLDVERVEILKGPQPTYLGKNAIAGALSIVSKRPGRDFSANVTAYNEFEADEQNVEGGVTVPLGNTLSMRVAGRYSNMAGWMRNRQLDTDTPHFKTAAVRASLLWEPNENFSLYAKYDHNYLKRVGTTTEPYNCGLLAPVTGAYIQPGEDCSLNGVTSAVYRAENFPRLSTTGAPNPDYGVFELNGGVVEAAYDWNGNTITAIASYYKTDQFDRIDADSSNVQITALETFDNSTQKSLELRAASPTGERLSWLVGAYGDIIDLTTRVPGGFFFAGDPRFGGLPAGIFSEQRSKQREKSWSVYGELGFKVVDQLTIKAAARYSSIQKTATFSFASNNAIYLSPGQFLVTPAGGFTISDDQIYRDFQPAVTVEFRPARGMLLFASYKEGFKSGGYDLDAFAPTPSGDIAFEPEKVQSFEAGAKIDFLDGRARFNVTAFRADYDDLQVSVYNGVAGVETKNAATSRSQGVEVEAQFAPVRGLVLSGSVNYLDAKYGSFANTACYAGQAAADGCIGGFQDLSGKTRAYSPEWSGTAGADLTTPLSGFLGDGTEFTGGVNLYFTSRYATSASLGPRAFQEGFTTVDARAGLNFADRKFGIALIGRNLTNERIYDGRNPAPLSGNRYFSAQLRRTRQVSLQLSAKF